MTPAEFYVLSLLPALVGVVRCDSHVHELWSRWSDQFVLAHDLILYRACCICIMFVGSSCPLWSKQECLYNILLMWVKVLGNVAVTG